MALAISLWFDIELENRIRGLWHELAAEGIDSPMYDGRYRPHITLGVWDAASLDGIQIALRAWVMERPAFGVEFQNVGLFAEGEGVAFLQPVVTGALIQIHHQAHELLAHLGMASAAPYYRPGHWVPHCTMASGVSLDRTLEAARYLVTRVLPVRGTVAAAGLIDTPAEVELERFELRT